jgi:phosphoribosylaminoimidazolecarboxamide formyltransferase / IMP cyclohydrolase
VLVDPVDYAAVLDAIESGGVEAVDPATRRRLAARAFAHVSAYDALVTSYLREDEAFPAELSVSARLLSETRYGENPHQRAAIYTVPGVGPAAGIATWSVDQSKEMSYNNYLDASAAWGCAQQFDEPAVVIVKHTIPCGVGTAPTLAEAFPLALSGDPVSAFGGVFAANREVDEATVDAIARLRLDVMIAPGYTDGARERLRRRRNLRMVTVGNTAPVAGWEVRSVPGGLLVQEPDRIVAPSLEWNVVTDRQSTSEELLALDFAWRVVPWVKSNAIVLAQDGVVTGVGAGQPNRVESVRIAVKVAGERAAGSVLASDAFFPFPDGIEAAAEAGVSAIVQPGGSVRDDECIAAANAAGMAMLFTAERHFRH